MFDKLVIIGVGLIGGSVALAARRAGLARQIVGAGRPGEALEDALRLGVIDAAASPVDAVKNADCILLAIPVGKMPEVMAAIAPHIPAHAIVTDAGSTKGDVADAARTHMGIRLPRFVPAHPIAGAEKSGVIAARTELFDGKNVVLTPLEENDADAVAKADAFWRACGANVTSMSTEVHDQIFASISHLPHVLAFALVEEIARRPNAAQLFGFAAGGFRDFSRIAGSSPEMWRDICLANRNAMLLEIDAYQQRLGIIRNLIEHNDSAELANVFTHAREARTAWAERHETKKQSTS